MLRYPHVLVKTIIAHPIHSLHNGPEFGEPVILHVVLSIAFYCFRVDPHACCESGPHPLLIFLSSDFVHYRSGIAEFCLRLGGIFQIESVIHEGLPELPQHVFPCAFGPFTLFGIWPILPVFSSQRRNFCTPLLRLPAPGANATTILEELSSSRRRSLCLRGSPFR